MDKLNERLVDRLEALERTGKEQPSGSPLQPVREASPAETRVRITLRLSDIAAMTGMSRPTIERLRSGGNLPEPDARIGKILLWFPSTIEAWLEGQPGQFTKKRKG